MPSFGLAQMLQPALPRPWLQVLPPALLQMLAPERMPPAEPMTVLPLFRALALSSAVQLPPVLLLLFGLVPRLSFVPAPALLLPRLFALAQMPLPLLEVLALASLLVQTLL